METTDDLDFTTPTGPYNMVGIVPLAGYQNQYDYILPDYLTPVGAGFLPIHKSIMECAFAGCDAIWVVCNQDYAPLVKHYIGDSVFDPMSYQLTYLTRGGKKRYKMKRIHIMYMPMHTKYLSHSNIPFSTLYGAYMVKKVANRISKWNKPNKYFVSFTNHMYDIKVLNDLRSQIKGKKPFFVSHNTRTVIDGEYASFTFDNKDLNDILKLSKLRNNLPIDEIFSGMNTQDKYVYEPAYSFDIRTWDGLREFLGSPETQKHKAMNSIFSSFKFKPLYRESKNVTV
jgi:hypothetical protein